MTRPPARSRPDLDAALARMPRQEDPDLLLALARRRCPRCGNYLFREPGRVFCLVCSWEHNDGRWRR